MNYHAPNSFKIVIVMKDSNAIIVSEYIQTNSFESQILWDLTGIDLENNLSDAGVVSGNIQGDNITTHNWFITGLNTLIRVVLTAILELGVLWLFGFRKKSTFIKVGIVNAITQTLLSIMLISMYLRGGMWNYIFLTAIGEFIAFIFEVTVYILLIDEKKYLRIILYTLTANIVTIIAGVFLISII